MHLYDINTQIESLLTQLPIDEDTGEILPDAQAICTQLAALDMERRAILEHLAKVVLDCQAHAAMLRTEEARLAERRHRLQKQEARLMQVLDRECAGQKTDLGVATLRYRHATRVEVEDLQRAIRALQRRKLTHCIRRPDPQIDKNAVKEVLQQGETIPGLSLVDNIICSLK